MKEQIKTGDRLRVLKGARVFSTTPGWPVAGKISSRTQVVTVSVAEPEAIAFHAGREVTIPGKVRWKGTGGYWRWTDLKNTEQPKNSAEREG